MIDLDDLTKRIIGAAIEVHREVGPGLLESTYELCLARELSSAGLRAERQVELPVVYKGDRLDAGYRIDILVEGLVVLELKAIESLLPVHTAQLITYLKLARMPVGLLLNFNVERMTDGVTRRVLSEHLPPSAISASLR